MTKRLWMAGLCLLLLSTAGLKANPVPVPEGTAYFEWVAHFNAWDVADYPPPGQRLVFTFDLKTLFLRLGIAFLLILGLGYYMGGILHRASWPSSRFPGISLTHAR